MSDTRLGNPPLDVSPRIKRRPRKRQSDAKGTQHDKTCHTCQAEPPPTPTQPVIRDPTVTYLGDLDTPVEQQLRADVVLVLVHVVEEAAVGHELRDQLDGGAQADAQQTHQVGVLHAGHDQGLLSERGGERTRGGLSRLLQVENH